MLSAIRDAPESKPRPTNQPASTVDKATMRLGTIFTAEKMSSYPRNSSARVQSRTFWRLRALNGAMRNGSAVRSVSMISFPPSMRKKARGRGDGATFSCV